MYPGIDSLLNLIVINLRCGVGFRDRARSMNKVSQTLKVAQCLLVLSVLFTVDHPSACTISEDIEDGLPLNSVEIPNVDRTKIARMLIDARRWPDVEIRGIVYAGGYVLERDPMTLAAKRATALKAYLIQLGIKEHNIWVDTRKIKEPDVDDRGNKVQHQIAVTLVPICNGGCERLCNDPGTIPTSRTVK